MLAAIGAQLVAYFEALAEKAARGANGELLH